ncbi:MAG: glycosyltransferase [Methyloprofundus sp.]|nr:glycosyltransferase [Methyloprofundus sp.]
MKVNIGVVGRFHAFDLARELKRHDLLNKLITTYPKFKVKEWEIDKNDIVSELPLEILNRYRKKLPLLSNNSINSFVNKQHAKNAARYLDECDIYIGWSGSSLETIIKAKEQNKITILERGSSHYSHQMATLLDEYKKYANTHFIPNYMAWQRELLEYELADYISIPSSYVQRTFVENGIPEEKLLLNPYGVNLSKFEQVTKKDSIFRIIYAGGLSLRKGSHYLLQAFYELNLPNCELWHLGSITDEIKPFINQYPCKNISFFGHLQQDELHKYYSQGSVFIMASIEEGMAMVQLQAMACGLPLICTMHTGGDDLMTANGKEGFAIPAQEVDALKEKILFMYDNQSLAKEMGQRAKKRVSNGFSWADYGNRYVKNLNTIIQQ